MRKIVLIILVLFIIKLINAQERLVIKSPVELTQGYLLLVDNLDVDYWQVQIINRVENSDGTYTNNIDEIYELVGKNYLKIPDSYCVLSDAYVKVKQFKKNGSVNIELQKLNNIRPEQPGGGSDWLGEFFCNGSTYAWAIAQIGLKSNNVITSSIFSLNLAAESVDQTTGIPTPYYEYFKPANFFAIKNQLTNSISQNYQPYINGVWYQDYYWIGNELLNGSINQAAPFASPAVIRLQYDPLNLKKDASGADITGVNYVYGIAKGLGPWGGNMCYSTGTYAFSSFQGTKSTQWAIDLINNDSQANPINYNRPSLSCSSINGGLSPSPIDIPDYNDPKNRIRKVIDSNINMTNWDFFISIHSLFGSETSNWWDKYYAISLTKISGNTNEVLSAKISDFFNSSGEKVSVPLNLSDGLYNILIQFENGSNISIITERNLMEASSSNNLSNYLTESIFPVPIVDNCFSISISATKELKIIYNLLDFNLNQIYQADIMIGEGESSIISINPDVQIPEGLLVNQFIFEDGSQTSIITTK